MSFTAEVKDELSRVEPGKLCCQKAELAALVRIEGTLHIAGPERFQLELATETAPVARKMVKLLHRLYGLKTEITVRRSILHKTNNYLIAVVDQPRLPQALNELGILDDSMNLTRGIPPRVVRRNCCAISCLRGAFLGGGFVADPHGDFHFELTADSRQVAEDLSMLMRRFEIQAKVSQRRELHTAYLKGAEPIVMFLALAGAHSALLRTENVRVVKSMRNEINRLVNAETANLSKAADASLEQIEAIELLDKLIGLENLPPALRDLGYLRLENPEVSLRELGELAEPPLSKSAVYHRVRRITDLARRVSGGEA